MSTRHGRRGRRAAGSLVLLLFLFGFALLLGGLGGFFFSFLAGILGLGHDYSPLNEWKFTVRQFRRVEGVGFLAGLAVTA
jgi:hypothetical protein